jgi:hypothetical protein
MSRGAWPKEYDNDRRICLWLSILCSESAMISVFSVCILMTRQTFFNTAPFEGKTEHQIIRLVTNRLRPERLNSPAIDNGVWELIQLCWSHKASERPTMQKIIETMAPFVPPSFSSTPPLPPASATATSLSGVFPALLASLNKVCTFKHQCAATDKS